MLTFEKVLDVFADALDRDPLYEVIQTSHGYTLMGWEPMREKWSHVERMATPEELRDALLNNFATLREEEITGNERDLTDDEQAGISAECEKLKTLCET